MSNVIDIPYRSIVRIAIVFLVLIFLWTIRDIVALLLLSIVIASAVSPAAGWLSRRGIPRELGVLAIYLGGILLLGALIYLVVPPLLNDVQRIGERFPVLLQELLEQFNGAGNQNVIFDGVEGYVNEAVGRISIVSPQLFSGDFVAGFSALVANVLNVVGGVMSTVVAIVISFYLAVREKGIENFLRSVVPAEHEAYAINLWQRTQQKMGRWAQGQVILALIVGLLVFIGLTFLDVPFALTLALVTAALELIPMVGPILASVPAVILAFLETPLTGLFTVGLYIVVQQIENHLLAPQVMKRTLDISPVILIVALLVGAKLDGVMGMVLAVPLAAALNEVFNDMTDRRQKAVVV